MDEQLPERQRVRLLYKKGESIKFISHLDEFRMWERTLRRADLPLLYKQGFNPQPHMQFASPLGVGFTGAREPLDITFSPPVPLNELRVRLEAKLPPGVAIHSIEEVPFKTPSLQSLLMGADYTILLYAEPDEIPAERIQAQIATFLTQTDIPRQRERKGAQYTYNLRPLVYELRYEGYDPIGEEHRIFLRVQQREGATGRPDEVVDALGFDDFARTLRRERLYLENDPTDVQIFAHYPLVAKEDVEVLSARSQRRKKYGKRKSAKAAGTYAREVRSINERAGDEFV